MLCPFPWPWYPQKNPSKMPISLQGATLCDDSRATAADHVANRQERIVTMLRTPFEGLGADLHGPTLTPFLCRECKGAQKANDEAEEVWLKRLKMASKCLDSQTLSKKLEASAASAPALDPWASNLHVPWSDSKWQLRRARRTNDFNTVLEHSKNSSHPWI